ncbi:discoidin domain-containing protein [Planotetraspora sp. A-T 1434]|uniref:discoidin domain-containing protein n=1 Tax=Planotetraspora sp. A-T 1434 TaxID=2979219 RepID=UPI0021BF5344|nr:discoidin domain-containing protein [Planotetraspora sp. A-T 1434]MCT9931284.1 discoidin domain-containing protein [Planotetraspora sp. A-T 1434]
MVPWHRLSRRSRLLLLSAVVTLPLIPSSISVTATGASADGATDFYVSVRGDDGGPGTRDRPFKTLERARDAVRGVNGQMNQDVVVHIGDGTYVLDRPLELTAADSGANGHDVIYRALPGRHPVISGGRTITGWTLYDAAKNIYRADAGDLDTRQLYVDGKRATRARTPDNPATFTKTATGFTTSDPAMAAWKNQSGIEIVSRKDWKLLRCPVASITGSDITVREPCWHNANLHTGIGMEQPTWIENAYELIDQPGEWYLDKGAHALYYKPLAGQDPRTVTVVAGKLESLIKGTGTVSAPIHNIRFEGLTFSHSTWLAPNTDEGYADVQAGFHIVGADNPNFDATRDLWAKTPAAVTFENDRDITFKRNVFTQLGAAGLNLDAGTKDAKVKGNRFADISSAGIQLGGISAGDHHPDDPRRVTEDNTLADNVVTNVAAEYADAVGIFVGYTTRTSVTHNKLYDLPYSAISIGWGFGLTDPAGNPSYPGNSGVPIYDTPTTSIGSTIQTNLIYDVMKKLSDGGGIYHLGADPGTVISRNYIHDVGDTGYGPIYLDEGSRYVRVTENALCRLKVRWLLINGGGARHNTAEYNFTDNATTALQGSPNNVVANNTTVSGCDALPASVTGEAGLEPAFRDLDPGQPSADHTAPSAPTGLQASAVLPTVADLSWTPSTDDTGVTGYEIYRDGRLVSAGASSPVRISGLTPGSTYPYTVRARDTAGNLSDESTPVVLTMPGAVNLALGKTATASSEFSSDYTPAKAVDGSMSSRWAQGSGLPDPSWLQVDLGSVKQITAVVTTFEKSNGYKYKIEYSADSGEPANWSTLDDHTSTYTTAQTNYSLSGSAVNARYIRITVTDSSWNGGSVFELAAYGPTS